MLSPTQLHPAEVACLRRVRRPGDEIAVYSHARRGATFLLVGPCSPMQTAPGEWRGRKLVGFADLTSGCVVAAQAVAA